MATTVELLPLTFDPEAFHMWADENFRRIVDALGTIQGISSGLALTGEVVAWAGSGSIPPGWLLCDGQLVNRDAYANLFTVIGTTYGSGANTFAVPDMRDLTVYGAGGTVGAIGALFGSASAVATHFHGHSGTHSHTVNGHTHFTNTNAGGVDHYHGGTTGAMDRSPNHTHNNANGTVFMNCSATHGHGGGCGQASESASYGGCTGFGCNLVTDNNGVDHLHGFNTNWSTAWSHQHSIPSDAPGTNAISPGNTDNAGVGNGNYPPGRVLRFLIRI